MASIIPGFEYDIFISYRHNDNRSGWVTEFVKHLNEELAAAIKEPVSVYFDSNSHDGLLETHNVDKSLSEKLKCLIFLPILSQTYCDPKSFAWQHEFCAFKKLIEGDQFGMNVRLSNGNVTSRFLPIKIHDLDAEDKALVEKEIGEVLRAIEFIFKSPGVNRPLRSQEEHPQDNETKTYYRDQINKVANAVKGIISAVKNSTGDQPGVSSMMAEPSISKRGRKKLSIAAGVVFVLSALAFGLFYLTDIKNKVEQKENSIAVLPFTNLSNDPGQDYFCDGTTDQIIRSLSGLQDLRVIAFTSVMRYKSTPKSIADIGKELNVTHVLEGTVKKSGDQIRVSASLIRVNDESSLWTQDFDNKAVADILSIMDAVSMRIATSLKSKLHPGEKERLILEKPSNPEAYEHYLKGEYIHEHQFGVSHLHADFKNAEHEFKSAIQLDSTFATAYAALANLYDSKLFDKVTNEDYVKLCTTFADKAYKLNPSLPYALAVKFMAWKGTSDQQQDSAIRYQEYDSAYKYITKAYRSAPNSAMICAELGSFLGYKLGLYPQGISFLKRAYEINPASAAFLPNLSMLFYWSGDLESAENLANQILILTPNDLRSHYLLIRIACARGDTQKANLFLNETRRINPDALRLDFLTALVAAAKGETKNALSLVTKIKPDEQVNVYLQLKMKNEALQALEWSIKEFYLFDYLNLQASRFDILKGDPRFEKILAQKKIQYETNLRRFGSILLPGN